MVGGRHLQGQESGVLRTTGIVIGSKSSMPSPGRATGCPCLLVLSLCYHCKSCVLSKQGWQVTILPDQTLHARLRAWKGLGCQGSGWWPGSWLATNPWSIVPSVSRLSNDKAARRLPEGDGEEGGMGAHGFASGPFSCSSRGDAGIDGHSPGREGALRTSRHSNFLITKKYRAHVIRSPVSWPDGPRAPL